MANEQFKSYGFDLEDNRVPVAVILPAQQEAVVGTVVKLDGRSSIDPEGTGLTYTWSFAQTPVGSQVARFGFTELEDDASIVSFAPDITGTYKIQLVVSDGSLESDPTTALADIRILLVPHHSGFVPDASFIWNYLSDFWTKVEGRKKFETFWSAAIQITASELLKLYQYDYNKSIRDIQETVQHRWLSFEPGLELDREKVTFILAEDTAGVAAATLSLDPATGSPLAAQPDYTNLIAIPKTEGDFEETSFSADPLVGRILRVGGRAFTLLRSGSLLTATNSGDDGATAAASNEFTGSLFTADMVGSTLRILSGDGAGDYLITAFVDSATIEVELDGTVWGTESDLDYVVLPSSTNTSTFFADEVQVPGGLEKQNWRFSSTLISSEYDFELAGVSPGDVLEIEVTRVDIGLSTSFYAQVVSVDRDRLGFVLNLEDLVDGEAGGWPTDDIQVTLATDLQVRGLSLATDGELSYEDECAHVNAVVTSSGFRRTYFETELDPTTEINVGPFSIKARPLQIIRNTRIPVHDELLSVPVLQEYVKQPVVAPQEDGTFLLIVEGGQVSASREPYLLSENLDYILDDESTVSGTCNLVAGSDEIEIPFGDLIDRSIQEQDTITVDIGLTEQTFEVRRVLSADTLRVHPAASSNLTGATFSLTRRVSGKYLRFTNTPFSKSKPAPKRLWGEVAYFDNNQAVEDNFGVLVGVTRDDMERASVTIPYKSAVAGLMYALVNGPTMANATLAAQILLGLPFTQSAGIITDIVPGFRKNEDGSPLLGRILVEAQDSKGNKTGITNIYFYPHGRQIEDPDNEGEWLPAVTGFSGLADNPETGEEFKIGDAVAQFVPLSKGVQIQDYLATPDWLDRLVAQGNLGAFLQRYHAFQLLVNSDLISATDIDFVAQFMDRVKPHYLKITSALLKSVEDRVEVDERLLFGRLMSFFSVTGAGVPSDVSFDSLDENGSYLSLEGSIYVRYLNGEDLVTTQGSSEVTSASGGFLDARPALGESFDSPLLRPGDLLVIHGGSNKGSYDIVSVPTDTDANLDLTDVVFETLADQLFTVYRPLKNPIWAGTVSVTVGDGLVATQEVVGTVAGIGSAGVAVGDQLVFTKLDNPNPDLSRVYTIVAVVPDPVIPYVLVIPDPVEATDTYDAWIVRDRLMIAGPVAPYGATSQFFVNTVAFSPYFEFDDTSGTNDWLNVSLLKYGDQIVFRGISYTVLQNERELHRVLVSPAPAVAVSGEEVEIILHPERSTTVLSVDFLDRLPSDSLELLLLVSVLSSDTLVTSIGSADVTSSIGTDFDAELGVRPGDYVKFLEGPDSTIDVGHGDGLFLVREVLGGTTMRLGNDLSFSGNARYGIQRKISNEG